MMKFQKINVMLLIAVAYSNIGFAAAGDEIEMAERENKGAAEKKTTGLSAAARRAKYKAEYQKELTKHKEQLGLDPAREHSDNEINNVHAKRKGYRDNVGLNTKPEKKLGLFADEDEDEDDQAKDDEAKNFLLINNKTNREIAESNKRTQERAARREKEKGKSADYSLDIFKDEGKHGNTLGLKRFSDFSINELSDPNYVTSETIQNVTPEEIAALDPVKLGALLSNSEAIKALSEEQVQVIDSRTLAKVIKGGLGSKLNQLTSGNMKPIKELPDSFVDKLNPKQAQEIIKECDGIFGGRSTHLTDYFSKDQREHLRNLAKTTGDPKEEAKVRAIRLVKRLATNEKFTSDDENILRDTIGALNRAQKEAVVSSYADAIAKKSGLKEEKGKWWLFGNKKAESEGKIQTLENLLTTDVTKMMKDYNIKYNHLMFLENKKTNAITIRILNNKEIDKKILNIDPTKNINEEITKLIGTGDPKSIAPQSIKYFVDRYSKKFISSIDLANSPETEFSTILTQQNISPEAKDLNNLDKFTSPLKEKIESALNERIISQLQLDPTKINPEFMKYVDVTKLSADQIKALSPDQIKALSVDQIKALSPDQIKAMSTDQIKALSPDQIKALSPEQREKISADALAKLSQEQLTALDEEAKVKKSSDEDAESPQPQDNENNWTEESLEEVFEDMSDGDLKKSFEDIKKMSQEDYRKTTAQEKETIENTLNKLSDKELNTIMSEASAGGIKTLAEIILYERQNEASPKPQDNGQILIIDPRTEMKLQDIEKRISTIDPENIKQALPELIRSINQTNTALKASSQKVIDATNIFVSLGYTGKFDDLEALKKFYRKNSLELHPDKQAGKTDEEKNKNQEKFKEVSVAYEILSNTDEIQTLVSAIKHQERLLIEFKNKVEEENTAVPQTIEQVLSETKELEEKITQNSPETQGKATTATSGESEASGSDAEVSLSKADKDAVDTLLTDLKTKFKNNQALSDHLERINLNDNQIAYLAKEADETLTSRLKKILTGEKLAIFKENLPNQSTTSSDSSASASGSDAEVSLSKADKKAVDTLLTDLKTKFKNNQALSDHLERINLNDNQIAYLAKEANETLTSRLKKILTGEKLAIFNKNLPKDNSK